jgi:hypothetical protein
MTLKLILKNLMECKVCVYLAVGKNEFLAVVHAILNLMVPLNAANSLTS